LGATFDSFNASCQSDSILALNLTNTDRVAVAIMFAGEFIGDYVMRVQSSRQYRAGIPAIVFHRLVNLIIESGAIRIEGTVHGTAEFTNCYNSVLTDLPPLEFGFGIKGISILPDDYLNIESNNNRCNLLVLPISSVSRALWFNPLMLVDTHVRFNSNHIIEMCDSNGLR